MGWEDTLETQFSSRSERLRQGQQKAGDQHNLVQANG